MRKDIQKWPVRDLRKRYPRINFPEYQREPNLWSRDKKQMLVDSMLRGFDISALYLFKDDGGSLDCVDGRQRIGAIMSFLGDNALDADNKFEVVRSNEIYEDAEFSPLMQSQPTFEVLKRLAEKEGNKEAQELIERILAYEVSVVELSKASRSEEFNLQFTRLNLGTIVNSGEKLNAMVGELRDICFNPEGLGQHPFLLETGIPTRRFSHEQLAAQIIAQAFSLFESEDFTRTRHFDLQRVFKEHATPDAKHRGYVKQVQVALDLLSAAFGGSNPLNNRAMTVSVVLLAMQEEIDSAKKAVALKEFVEEFMCRLRWQIGKGLDADGEYRWLVDFQRDVTQASVEKPAVERRAKVLRAGLARWRAKGDIEGDAVHRKEGGDPSKECREGS